MIRIRMGSGETKMRWGWRDGRVVVVHSIGYWKSLTGDHFLDRASSCGGASGNVLTKGHRLASGQWDKGGRCGSLDPYIRCGGTALFGPKARRPPGRLWKLPCVIARS